MKGERTHISWPAAQGARDRFRTNPAAGSLRTTFRNRRSDSRIGTIRTAKGERHERSDALDPGFIDLLGQRFDLAALPHALLELQVTTNPCRPDVEPVGGDGTVGIGDLLAVLSRWGTTSYIGDVNENGLVEFGDLLDVLAAWGTCVE